jgi:hypothetical protein
MNVFKNIISKIVVYKKKIGALAIGHTFNETFDHIFNYWIYIPVIVLFGTVKGCFVMTGASFIVCYLFIIFYDWAGVDWLGIEMLKESDFGPDFLQRKKVKSKIALFLWWPFHQIFKLVRWAQNKGGIAAFIVLSVYTDPFITTVFLRRDKFSGLNKKDWLVFISSVILGNFYWTLRTVIIILAAKFGFELAI